MSDWQKGVARLKRPHRALGTACDGLYQPALYDASHDSHVRRKVVHGFIKKTQLLARKFAEKMRSLACKFTEKMRPFGNKFAKKMRLLLA